LGADDGAARHVKEGHSVQGDDDVCERPLLAQRLEERGLEVAHLQPRTEGMLAGASL